MLDEYAVRVIVPQLFGQPVSLTASRNLGPRGSLVALVCYAADSQRWMSGMESTDDSQVSAFDAYVEALIEVIGHADRAEPLRDYCTGLMELESHFY